MDSEPFIQTPSLDRLAREAALFERFYVSSYPTIPCARTSSPGATPSPPALAAPGAGGRGALRAVPPGGVPPSAVLRHAPLGNDDGNFTRGFAGWQWVRGQHADRWNVGPFDPPLPAAPYKLKGTPQTRLYLRNTHDRVYERDWMCARTSARPWTGWSATTPGGAPGPPRLRDVRGHVGPHTSRSTPRPSTSPATPTPATPASGSSTPVRAPGLPLPGGARPRAGPVRALVTLADRWLGHLLDKLAVTGLDRHTLVLHLTDHGHLFGDHQLRGKPGDPLGACTSHGAHPSWSATPRGGGRDAGAGAGAARGHPPHRAGLPGAPIPEGVGTLLWPLIRGEQARVRDTAYSGRFPNELAALGLSRNRAQQAALRQARAGHRHPFPGPSGAPSLPGAPRTRRAWWSP